jgi:hypothetical protein
MYMASDRMTALYKAFSAEHAGAMDGVREQLCLVREELALACQKLENLYDLIERGKYTDEDLVPRLRKLREQVAALEVTKQQLELQLASPIPTTLDPKRIQKILPRFHAVLESKDTKAKKELLRRLIRKVTVTWEGQQWKITLEYSFPAPILLNAGNGVPDLDKYGRPEAAKPRSFERSITIQQQR